MPIDLAYSCHYCHSTLATNFLATERMLGLGGKFTYPSCGSIQLSTIPEDLGIYYPSDYYSFGLFQLSGLFRNLLKKIRIQAYFATGLKLFLPPFGGHWFKRLSPRVTDRIAGVGCCGKGQLLYELHVSGFEDLHGFDPFLEKGSQLLNPGGRLLVRCPVEGQV
jgi:hypothetical protein